MGRHGARAAAAALLLGGALAASANPARAQPAPTVVRIQDYPGPGNILFRIAIEKGFCEKRRLACRLQMIPSGPLGAQALLAKSIDVGFFPPEVQINAMIKGAKLKTIASMATLNVFLLAVRGDLDLPDVDKGYPAFMPGLKGRRIGVPARGSAAELQFQLMADKAGMKPTDFVFVAVGSPNTSQGALRSRQIDATLSFEPSGAICEVTKSCRVVYRGARSALPAEIAATNGAASNLVVAQEMIDDRKAVVDALIAAEEEAERFLHDPANFQEVVAISEKYFALDLPQGKEIMAVTLRTNLPSYHAALSRPALKATADYMLATRQLAEPFDTKTMVYADAP